MCLLAHTGGTTGFPKAVMLSDKAMNAVASQYINVSGIKRGEVFLNLKIPFVVYGILTNLHLPLCIGLESVVIPKFDANDWGKYIKKYHPNHVLAVPSYVNPMQNHPELQNMDLSCFISAGVGGDGMTDEMEISLNTFYKNHNSRAIVLKGFGMTEVCATAVVGFSYSNKIGSVGIPLPKVNIMIYDRENEHELKYGEVGEICIKSPSRMIGYMNDEAATDQLFWKHQDGLEWLHSGDLGYLDEDGFLFIVGRMKRVILTTKDGVAYKVFPNMPEEILDSHKQVQQSCIVGVKDGDDQVLCAYIVINEDDNNKTEQIEKELRAICDKQLPSYSRPAFYRFLNNIPLTAAGKVDYRTLEKMKI
ncbi:MAG: fatty acid--CoA ligase family protein [Lachnospiraceae bacterium]|nr:fatty acid--CoA ligase family protein [Lachnospiraceae bacterium]